MRAPPEASCNELSWERKLQIDGFNYQKLFVSLVKYIDNKEEAHLMSLSTHVSTVR